MLVIDPMHNLFFGTAKHMLKLWFQLNLVKRVTCNICKNNVDDMIVPADVSRVPHKIQSGFSGFTADQLKNWVTIYSIPALFDLLPSEHFECWRHFVLACRILCRNSISYDSLKLPDVLLIRFCKRVERLYGEEAITPNIHLHCHICEVESLWACTRVLALFI